MRPAALLLASVLLLAPSPAAPAPRLKSEQECVYFADMALVSRALAEEGVPIEKAGQINQRIYPEAFSMERGMDVARLVLASAYRSKLIAQEFSLNFLLVCKTERGNVDSLLGTSL